MNTIKYMLCALHDAGFTDGELSRRTEIPQPTVTRLRNGQHLDTSYAYGKRIEALYNELLGAGKAA
jgi:predicted transcriptional regulator